MQLEGYETRLQNICGMGKQKAVTFSYDDGVCQDRRLVAMFNYYHVKATFNINSGMQKD